VPFRWCVAGSSWTCRCTYQTYADIISCRDTRATDADAASVVTQRVQPRTSLTATRAAAAGGDVTWHGPGQAVLYPIVHVRELGTGARRYVEGLEDTMVHTAAEYGLRAYVRGPALAPAPYMLWRRS
jgi:hypothetical protein